MAQFGQYTYESPESRALKGIRAEGYNKDMAKNLIQLNHNSEYMAQYLRKLQKGVDDANENFIQQIQGFANDLIVFLGGGTGSSGLELGDLKYIFQMFGSMLGLTDEHGNLQLPINIFNSIWHMLSTFIFPVEQFDDVINALIDGAIALMLDWFGEIPIIGEAVQQFAAFIGGLRDFMNGLHDWVAELIDNIISAIRGIPIVGGVIADVFSAVADLLGLGTDAQTTASDAQDQIAIMQAKSTVSGGVTIIDEFDGTAGTNMSSRGYIEVARGAGAGTYTLDGNGNAKWNKSGNAYRFFLEIHPTPLSTNKVAAKIVVNKKRQEPSIFMQSSQQYVVVNCNEDGSEYYYIRWEYYAAYLGYYSGGTNHDIQSVSIDEKDGDAFEIRLGESGTARNLRGYRNGLKILDKNDTAAVIDLNSSHLRTGWIAAAGTNGFFDQNNPSEYSTFTAKDI